MDVNTNNINLNEGKKQEANKEEEEEEEVDERYVFLGLDCSNLLGTEAKALLEGLHESRKKEGKREKHSFDKYLHNIHSDPFQTPGNQNLFQFRSKSERQLHKVCRTN